MKVIVDLEKCKGEGRPRCFMKNIKGRLAGGSNSA